jgi:uncharacterized membrane protein
MSFADLFGALRFVHIIGAFIFVAGHGVSMLVAFRLRREAEVVRMKALLDLSALSLNVALAGLLLLLASGIGAGIAGNYFGQLWIWLSLILLIVVGALMTPLGRIHYSRLRLALGMRTGAARPAQPDPVPLTDPEIAALLRSRQPELLLLLGGGGFLVILWLMVFRPF